MAFVLHKARIANSSLAATSASANSFRNRGMMIPLQVPTEMADPGEGRRWGGGEGGGGFPACKEAKKRQKAASYNSVSLVPRFLPLFGALPWWTEGQSPGFEFQIDSLRLHGAFTGLGGQAASTGPGVPPRFCWQLYSIIQHQFFASIMICLGQHVVSISQHHWPKVGQPEFLESMKGSRQNRTP